MGKDVPVLKSNVKLNNVRRESDNWVKIGNQRVSKEAINNAKSKGYSDDEINAIIQGENLKSMQKDFVDHSTVENTRGNVNVSKKNIMNKYGVSSDDFDTQYKTYKDSGQLKQGVKNKVVYNEMTNYYNNLGPNNSNVKKDIMSRYNMTEDEFNDAYKEYKTVLNEKRAKENQKMMKGIADWTSQNFATKALGTVAKVGLDTFGRAADSGVNYVNGLLGGDVSSNDYLFGNMSDAFGEGATEGMNGTENFLYNIGTGGVSMLGQAWAGTPIMIASQGLSTAGDMMKQSLEQGNSQEEAMAKGLLGGTVGAVMAKTGADKLIKLDPKSIGGTLAKGFVTEALEEGAENLADLAIDEGVSYLTGSKSGNAVLKEQLRAAHPDWTESQINDEIIKTRAMETAQDAFAGGIMGSAFGGLEYKKQGTSYNPTAEGLINVGDTKIKTDSANPITTDSNVNSNVETKNISDVKVEPEIQAEHPTKVDVLNPKSINAETGKAVNTNVNPEVNTNTEVNNVVDTSIDNTADIDALYNDFNVEEQVSGLKRNDTSDIFKSSKKPINRGYKQQLTDIINNSLTAEQKAETKGLRHDLSMAINDYVENPTKANYDTMMGYYNQIAEYVPEYNGNSSIEVENTPNRYETMTLAERPENNSVLDIAEKYIEEGETQENALEYALEEVIDENENISEVKKLQTEAKKYLDSLKNDISEEEMLENLHSEPSVDANKIKYNNRTELQNQFDGIINHSDVAMTRDFNDAMAIIKDRNTTTEQKSKAWTDFYEKYYQNENFDERYGDSLIKARNLIKSLESANSRANNNIPTQNTNIPNQNKHPEYVTTKKETTALENTVKKNTSKEDFNGIDRSNYLYDSMKEKNSVDAAQKRIDNDGIENLTSEMMNKQFESSVDTDASMMMAQEWKAKAEQLELEGKTEESNVAYENYMKLLNKVAMEGSKSGQVLQSLKKWNRNTPEGALAYANAEIEKAMKKHMSNSKIEQLSSVEDSLESIVKNSELTTEEKIEASNKAFESNRLIDGKSEMEELIRTGKNVDTVDIHATLNQANKIFKMDTKQQIEFIKEAKKLQDIEVGTREYDLQMAKLARIIDNYIPNSIGDYFKSFLYDNMLGSIRTIVSRNMGGNFGMQIMEQYPTKALASLIDKGLSKLTGNENRLRGVTLEGITSYNKGFAKGFKSAFNDVVNVFKKGSDLRSTRSGEMDLADYYAANKHMKTDSKNKALQNLSKAFDKWDSTIKTVMNLGDKPFYEARYNQCITEWNRMRKEGTAFKSLSDSEFKTLSEAYAKLEATRAVYQDNSQMAKAFQGMKNMSADFSEGLFGADVLSQFTLPMVRVPGNVADRVIQYSPLGFIRTGVTAAKNYYSNGKGKGLEKLRTGSIDQNSQANIATMLARNLIGTGTFAAGAGLKALADKTEDEYGKENSFGLTGGYSDDSKVAAAQRERGEQEYALRIGGRDYDISWLTGLGTGLQSGATFMDAYQKEGDLSNAMLQGAQGAFDNSMTQGLNRLIGGDNSYSYDTESNLLTNAKDTVLAGSSQLVPAWLRQTANMSDDYKRELGPYKSNEYYLNSLKNGVPFLRQTLPEKIDSAGEKVKQNDGMSFVEKALTNYILPGTVTVHSNREDLVNGIKIFEQTGNPNAIMPSYSKTSIKNYFLDGDASTEKYLEVKERVGKLDAEMYNAVVNSDLYNSFGDDYNAKADLLDKAYKVASYVVKNEYKEGGYKVTQDKKYYDAYVNGGTEGFLDYAKTQAQIDSLDTDGDNKVKKEEVVEYAKDADMTDAEKGNMLYVKSSSKAYDAVIPYGMDCIWYLNQTQEAYSNGGKSVAKKQKAASNYINSLNISDEAKGAIWYNGVTDSNQYKQAYEKGGYANVWALHNYKIDADSDKNGSVTSDEAKNYLDNQNKLNPVLWYPLIYSGYNKKSKNPYK